MEKQQTHILLTVSFLFAHIDIQHAHTHRKTPTSVVIVLLYVCVSFCPYYIDCVICAERVPFSSLLSHVFIFSPLSLSFTSLSMSPCAVTGEENSNGRETQQGVGGLMGGERDI